MTGKIIIAAVVLLMIGWSAFNSERKKEEERLRYAYHGWLIETGGKIRMPFLEWKALHGGKYKNGKPD